MSTKNVREFREKFKLPLDRTKDHDLKGLRQLLSGIREEYDEMQQEIMLFVLNDPDFSYTNMLKELADMQYMLDQLVVWMKLDHVWEEAKQAVHENNMSKVGPNGEVKYNEDGKVMKPRGYRAVDFSTLLQE